MPIQPKTVTYAAITILVPQTSASKLKDRSSRVLKQPLVRDQQSVGSEMKNLTYDLGYDNVLLGQGYHRLLGTVMDWYGSMVEWPLERDKPEDGNRASSRNVVF